MKSLGEINLSELKWVQKSSQEDELLSGNDAVGALHWASLWSSLATAESVDGTWTLKRAGFIHPKITIREVCHDIDAFTADVGWSGEATLSIPGQGTFKWTPNFWHTKCTLLDSEGKEIMAIELSGFINVGGNVTIKRSSISSKTFSLLVLFGWHLIMNALSDDASSTAAIVPAVIQ